MNRCIDVLNLDGAFQDHGYVTVIETASMVKTVNANEIVVSIFKRLCLHNFCSFLTELDCSNNNCPENMFECGSHECIEKEHFCDGSPGKYSCGNNKLTNIVIISFFMLFNY